MSRLADWLPYRPRLARPVHQKGVDLVIESAQTIVDAGGGQIVVIGKGEARFEHCSRPGRAPCDRFSEVLRLPLQRIDVGRHSEG